MIIDLCCGIGRFPGDDVVSIDVDPKTRPTILADIAHLPLRAKLHPKLVHASPPCKYLSNARVVWEKWNEKGVAESLRLVAACFDAFAWLEPKMWTLENPVGKLRHFMKPTVTTVYEAHDLRRKRTDFWSNNRGLKRALIPMDIRQKILKEAEG